MQKENKLEFDDYIITYKPDSYYANFEIKSINSKKEIKHEHLDTGELFFSLELFNGFMFQDNHGNFFDTAHGKYYNKYYYFIGDKDKIPFVVFDNNKDELIKQKIKEAYEKRKNEEDDSKKIQLKMK